MGIKTALEVEVGDSLVIDDKLSEVLAVDSSKGAAGIYGFTVDQEAGTCHYIYHKNDLIRTS